MGTLYLMFPFSLTAQESVSEGPVLGELHWKTQPQRRKHPEREKTILPPEGISGDHRIFANTTENDKSEGEVFDAICHRLALPSTA